MARPPDPAQAVGPPPVRAVPGKQVYLARRHPHLTLAEFRGRWRQHARIGEVLRDDRLTTAVTALRYLARTERTDVLPGASTELDGVALLSLRSLASIPPLHTMLTQNDPAFADELRVFERPVEDTTMYTASELVVAGDETEAVVIELGRRRADVGAEAHLDAADDARRPIAAELAPSLGVRRWVRNLLVAPPARGAAFDVVTELWFDSVDAVAAAGAGVDRLLRESSPLTDPAGSVQLACDVNLRLGRQTP